MFPIRKGVKRNASTALGPEHLTVSKSVPYEVFYWSQFQRQLGFPIAPSVYTPSPLAVLEDFTSLHVPGLLREREYKLGKINKIFASQWLNDKQVVCGTKCNKLMVMDVDSGRMTHIPSLKSSSNSTAAQCPCGIHSISVNPSRTLLATGAENTNDLAVYKLPTFDPLCVGEGGHHDWIFDLVWLDDEFVITGSRDSRLGLWKIDSDKDSVASPLTSLQIPEYNIVNPLAVKDVEQAHKVRALAYHDDRKELGVLSLNAFFHLWDVERFCQKYNRRLPHSRENVCMAVSKTRTAYAVGSQSHVNVVDPRCKDTITTILSKYRGGGIRSVSFREDVVTIGTGVGVILFFDLKAGKYLESGCGHPCALTISKGWLLHDDNFRDYFMDQNYPNAIYTHNYDESGTRLFSAGGPLPAGLWGNYGGLWL